MSAISWNCRGLGNPPTVNALQKVVLEKDPTLVFLMETKFDVLEMDGIKRKIERQQGLVVPSIKWAGGLALLWRNSLQVDIQTYSRRHIDAIVVEEQGTKKWRFTDFYGYPKTGQREESWKLLENFSHRSDLPWICMGDYNEIMHAKEKEGGGVRPEGQMRRFREVVNRCQLRDLGYMGLDFTWSRRLGSKGWVRERLDRAMVSKNWAATFPVARLFHVATSVSDHSILLLKESRPTRKQRKHSKMWRFESMWLEDERCIDVVHDAWERGRCKVSQWPLEECIEECRASLKSWNTQSFGHVGKQVAKLQRKLQALENLKGAAIDLEETHNIKKELNKWLGIEEEMWHERSRNNWLKAGDKNTLFFHTKASNRHQRNTINRIMDDNNMWHDDMEQVGQIFMGYFDQLFTTSRPKVVGELIDALHAKVTDRMNYSLIQDFQAGEVEKALKQMHPLTAPGPDSMPPLFYHHLWPTVKSIVINIALDFLNHGIAPPKFHDTHIVLIPKTKNLERVTYYKPISLCNVAYKIASKVVTNMMKSVLQEIIGENQSAFVAERLITDNVLVAHEMMNHISKKRKGKCGEMAVKLDMSKAYDRVEWDCLQLIMQKLGFHERWISTVMRCVSSMKYAVRINGQPCSHILPTRGLRQGDPLSPYHFLLCAEGLSTLLHQAT